MFKWRDPHFIALGPSDRAKRLVDAFLSWAITWALLLRPTFLFGERRTQWKNGASRATIAVLLIGSLVVAGSRSSAAIVVTHLADSVNTLPLSGNQSWTGQLGDDFTTSTTITISSIGVFDDNGDGTMGEIFWEIFDVPTGNRLHFETVPATGARTPGSTIEDNYVWQTLSGPLVLEPGTYSVVAVGFDSIDRNFNTNLNAQASVEFNTVGLTAAGGRYSGLTSGGQLPDSGAGNSASTQSYNFGAATFEYSVTAIPEPARLVVWSLIGILGMTVARRRRR